MTFNAILLILAVFFCLSGCRPATRTDPDAGAAAPVVVDPAAPAAPAPGPDGGSSVVMPEAKVQLTPTPAATTAPADVTPTATKP